MKEAQEAGIPVVAIANPGSGPGTDGDRSSYEMGMQALCDSGVEVCTQHEERSCDVNCHIQQ